MPATAAFEARQPEHISTKQATSSVNCTEHNSAKTSGQVVNCPETAAADFTRWRPNYHLQAPHGWMNDPCAPGYDPTTTTYLAAFQWNPNGNDWGHISWCQARSVNLIDWEVAIKPCLTPDASYDSLGVFTGCLHSSGVHGEQNGSLTAVYTSVNKLPIHYTLPYHRGSESLSLATSFNAGKTWEKFAGNPILLPPDEHVIGWRDPFISPWPAVDPSKPEQLYGIISGGILGKSPTTFIYVVDALDLTKWKYIGPLIQPGLNYSPSSWSGDFGVNWEVTNFLSLYDDYGNSREFLLMGAEGLKSDESIDRFQRQLIQNGRMPRGTQWLSGLLKRPLDEVFRVEMIYQFGGIFDHGCFYAASSFWDPNNEQRVVWGWITEEDLPDDLRASQGWSGMLSLPRAVKMQTISYVTRALRSDLSTLSNVAAVRDHHGTYTVSTLGIHPINALHRLRHKAKKIELPQSILYSQQRKQHTLDVKTAQWEFECDIRIVEGCTRVGFSIEHTSDVFTIVSFFPEQELVTIERPSFPNSNINTASESARHTLFTTTDPRSGKVSEELLSIRAWFDSSVFEVFINERTVISTRIYTTSKACRGIAIFAERGDEDRLAKKQSLLVKAVAWDGLQAKMTQV